MFFPRGLYQFFGLTNCAVVTDTWPQLMVINTSTPFMYCERKSIAKKIYIEHMKPKWPTSIFEVLDKLVPKLSIYSWFWADVIRICQLGSRHVGAHARRETVCKSIPIAIFKRSRSKSQDEIPVLWNYGKNLECPVRERYLKKISVVGVPGWRIFSGHTYQPVHLRMFASHRSLGFAFLFGFWDNYH